MDGRGLDTITAKPPGSRDVQAQLNRQPVGRWPTHSLQRGRYGVQHEKLARWGMFPNYEEHEKARQSLSLQLRLIHAVVGRLFGVHEGIEFEYTHGGPWTGDKGNKLFHHR